MNECLKIRRIERFLAKGTGKILIMEEQRRKKCSRLEIQGDPSDSVYRARFTRAIPRETRHSGNARLSSMISPLPLLNARTYGSVYAGARASYNRKQKRTERCFPLKRNIVARERDSSNSTGKKIFGTLALFNRDPTFGSSIFRESSIFF